MSSIKYKYREHIHNLKAPSEIIPYILSWYKPKSVVDVGCGTGTFLRKFKELGVQNVCGIEGKWVNTELLLKNIDRHEYIQMDLEKPFNLDRKFDLVLCIEVAEHLKEEAADELIESLVRLGDLIIFSAAIPHQGGQNHLNEQWPQYWIKKFSSYGFYFHDVFREYFWNNENVFWWYKQNLFLVKKKSVPLAPEIENKRKEILNYIHPELFHLKAESLRRIVDNDESFFYYLKLLARKLVKPFWSHQ